MFDYSSIRLFDKKGRALPADYMKTPDTFFYIKSEIGSGHDALLYPVTDTDGGAVKFAGMRVDDGGLLFADDTARRVDVRSVATNDVVCTAALKPADYMELNTADGKVYGVLAGDGFNLKITALTMDSVTLDDGSTMNFRFDAQKGTLTCTGGSSRCFEEELKGLTLVRQ